MRDHDNGTRFVQELRPSSLGLLFLGCRGNDVRYGGKVVIEGWIASETSLQTLLCVTVSAAKNGLHLPQAIEYVA